MKKVTKKYFFSKISIKLFLDTTSIVMSVTSLNHEPHYCVTNLLELKHKFDLFFHINNNNKYLYSTFFWSNTLSISVIVSNSISYLDYDGSWWAVVETTTISTCFRIIQYHGEF